MKILLIANSESPHTIKWAEGLTNAGVQLEIFDIGRSKTGSPFIKLARYILAIKKLKKTISRFQPDVVHAHFATGNGLLGVLSRFRPFIISVWGSDVFSFPQKSVLHKALFKWIIKRPQKILSTSHVMADEIRKYTDHEIEVIPFGIDLNRFKPQPVKQGLFHAKDIVIGTVKSLEKTNGIETLIAAFQLLKKKYPDLPLKLLLVGKGELESHFRFTIKEMALEKDCVITGFIPYQDSCAYHNMLSVFVAPSLAESFGVAVLEASACEKPVIVTKVGGLPEVVEDGKTGYIIPPQDTNYLANTIERFLLDPELSQTLGKAGRKMVERRYLWQSNLNRMIQVYRECI